MGVKEHELLLFLGPYYIWLEISLRRDLLQSQKCSFTIDNVAGRERLCDTDVVSKKEMQ